MAKGMRISGIYVPLQLETTAIQKDLQEMSGMIGSAIESIQHKFEGALNTKTVATGLVNLQKAIGSVRDSVTALSKAQVLDLSKIDTATKMMYGFKESVGLSMKDQQALYQQMLNTAAVNQQVSAFKSLERQLGSTEAASKAFKAMGVSLTQAAAEQVTPLGKLQAEYKRLAQLAAIPITKAGQKDFVDTQNIQAAVDAFKNIKGVLPSTKAEIQAIATAWDTTTNAVNKYIASQSKVAETRLDKLRAEYASLSSNAGIPYTKAGEQKFIDTSNIRLAVDSFNTLNNVLPSTKAEIQAIATEWNVSAKAVRDYVAAQQKTTLTPVQRLKSEYSQAIKSAGLPYSRQEERSFVDTGILNTAISQFEKIRHVLPSTDADFLGLAKSTHVATEAIREFVAAQTKIVESPLDKLKATYAQLAKEAAIPFSKEGEKKFIDTSNINKSIESFKTLNNGVLPKTRAEIEAIAKEWGTTTDFVRKYIAEVNKTSKASGRGMLGALTPSNLSAGLQSSLSAFGVVGGMYGAAELTKSAYQDAMKMENLSLAFESIYKNAGRASEQLEFVKQISDKLGLSFMDTAQGAKSLFAAAQGTQVEGQANKIFEAFSSMSAALKLTGSETSSVFLAISQMISKGKVSAEELRLQLAERMPGAVNLFAKSIGKTTQELDKMLQAGEVGLDSLAKFADEVQKTYSFGAENAAHGLQAELNRLETAWLFFKTAFVNSDQSAKAIASVTEALKTLTGYVPEIISTAKAMTSLGATLATFFAARKVVTAISDVWGAFKGASTAAAGFAASLKLIAVNPWVAAISLGVSALVGITMAFKMFGEGAEGVDKILDSYSGSLSEIIQKQKELGNMPVSNALKSTEDQFKNLMNDFDEIYTKGGLISKVKGMFNEKYENAYSNYSLVYSIPLKDTGSQTREFSKNLEDVVTTFGENFKEAIKSGDVEGAKDFLKNYITSLEAVKDQFKKLNVSSEMKENLDKTIGSAVALAKKLESNKEILEDIKNSAKFADLGVDINKVTKDLAALNNEAKNTTAFKLEVKSDNVSNAITQLGDIADAYGKSQAALNDYSQQLEEGKISSSAYDQQVADAKIVQDDFNSAVHRFSMIMADSRMPLNDILNAIASMGEKAGFSALKIAGLAAQVNLLVSASRAVSNAGKMTIEETLIIEGGKGAPVGSPEWRRSKKTEAAVATRSFEHTFNKAEKRFPTQEEVKVYQTGKEKEIERAEQKKSDQEAKRGAKAAQAEEKRIDRASEKVTRFREEIDKLNNVSFDNVLGKKLREIEKEMGTAGGDAQQLQVDYLKAFESKSVRDFDKALLEAKDDTEALHKLEVSESMDKWKATFKAINDEQARLGQPVTDYTNKLNEMNVALEKQNQIKDLQTAVKFYEELSSLSGDYNQSLETQNKLIELQAEAYGKTIKDKGLVEQWKALKELEKSRDPWAGIRRSTTKYFSEASDWATQFGTIWTDTMDGMTDALVKFTKTGVLNFQDLADNFIAEVERMMIKAAVSGLFSGIGSIGTSLFGVSDSAAASAASGAGINSFNFTDFAYQANGGVFSGGISSLEGGVYSSPTPFAFNTQLQPFANGGVLGERGKEAVMPVTTDSKGRLSVLASGGSSSPAIINITVINETGQNTTATASQQSNNNGGLDVKVLIKQTVAQDIASGNGGMISQAIQGTFGLKRAVRGR